MIEGDGLEKVGGEIRVLDPQTLWTREVAIHEVNLTLVDMSYPIFYGVDAFGNEYVTDGNHRAWRALCNGEELWGRQVAVVEDDISKNEDYRLVKDLKLIRK